jgi:hypothetical protein
MLTTWNWIRIMRLVFGIAAIVQGIAQQNHVITLIGGILTVQGIFNIGCCGAACAPSRSRESLPTTKETTYEEIK